MYALAQPAVKDALKTGMHDYIRTLYKWGSLMYIYKLTFVIGLQTQQQQVISA